VTFAGNGQAENVERATVKPGEAIEDMESLRENDTNVLLENQLVPFVSMASE